MADLGLAQIRKGTNVLRLLNAPRSPCLTASVAFQNGLFRAAKRAVWERETAHFAVRNGAFRNALETKRLRNAPDTMSFYNG